jgi:leader peptidase (prepilin peptidase)/N-methyltransferase
MPTALNLLQNLGAVFAALLGLAFGSFLNVVLTRFPEDESIATPRSHCRNCTHTLAWWENLPILSWLILRGRCRQCRSWIGLRYPLVELAIGLLWTACWLQFSPPLLSEALSNSGSHPVANALLTLIGHAVLCWLLVALAIFDAEYFWLPDWFTLPGIGIGFLLSLLLIWSRTLARHPMHLSDWLTEAWPPLVEILAAAAIVLVIRLAYWLIRRKEGMGLGDAKLMALLGAWLGLIGAVECFALAVFGATLAALFWLALLSTRRSTTDRKTSEWAKTPLPLGTFLSLAALSEIFYPDWPWTQWSALWTRLFLQ